MDAWRSKAIGIILVSIAALSWSTAGLFTRVVTTDIPTTLLWRSVFGGLAVLAYCIITTRQIRPSQLLSVNSGEAITVLVSSVATCCFIAAFFYTTIANVAFVYGMSAMVTVMVAWVLLGKRPDRITITAASVATLGAIILVAGGQYFSDFIGLGLAAAMTLLMASLPILTHRFPANDNVKVTYLSAFLIALVMAFIVDGFSLDTYNAMWLGLYGFVNVFLGFCIYLIGSKLIAPATTGLIGLTEVPLAPLFATVLFGEVLTFNVIFGGALIVGAALAHIVASTLNNAGDTP